MGKVLPVLCTSLLLYSNGWITTCSGSLGSKFVLSVSDELDSGWQSWESHSNIRLREFHAPNTTSTILYIMMRSSGLISNSRIFDKYITPDDLSVRATEELRFLLFRHWNLYDAMYHSSYVAGKLGIWRERGKKKLTGLLAKMGCGSCCCLVSGFRILKNLNIDSRSHKPNSPISTWTWT